MAFQRTTTEILADLTAARTARTTFLEGGQVQDVWRDGRRVRYSTMSLSDINEVIASLEREYETAVQVEAGRPRRRPIGFGFRN